MRWKLYSLLCQADGETLPLKKMHFCLKGKKNQPNKKTHFPLCCDSTGDKSHSGGFAQSTGPVAREVSEGSGL